MMPDMEKVIKGLQNLRDAIATDFIHEADQAVGTIDDAIELLKEQESRWVSIPHKKDRVCERCGYDEPYKNAEKETMIYKFCPNCGARMKGGEPDA